MTGISPLNGNVGTLLRPTIERRPDETLHDFLLRRHEEMGAELGLLHALVESQAASLREERRTAHQRMGRLIAGLALNATFAVALCWLWIFAALPTLFAGVALTGLLSGSLLVSGMPCLERAFSGRLSWRRR